MKSKQITINMLTNFINMGLSAFIGFWFTPIFIRKLGLSAYGYVGVINNIISFFVVITYTLNSMVGRFYTVSYKKGEKDDSNEYISTALITCILITAVLLPIIIIATVYLDKLIIIKTSLIPDVKLAFFLSCLTFFFTAILSVFMTGAYCENRLEISNGINILATLLRIGILFMLFKTMVPGIWFLSGSALVQNFVAAFLAYLSFRYLIPSVRFTFQYLRVSKAKELLSAGAFNSIILMGTTLMSQISIIVANRFLSAYIVGVYSSLVLIPTVIQQIAGAISSAFSPTTLAIYSTGNMEHLKIYSNKVVAICAYLLGWPISIAAAMGVPVFRLWLGKDFSSYEMLFAVLMLYLVANLSISQLNVVNQAVNKLKIPAFFSILTGILNCILSIVFVSGFNMGLWGITIATVISFTLRNIIFTPIYTAIITNQPWHAYFKGMLKPQIISILVFVVGYYIGSKYAISNILALFIVCVILTFFYCLGSLISLSKEERMMIIGIFKKKLSKEII